MDNQAKVKVDDALKELLAHYRQMESFWDSFSKRQQRQHHGLAQKVADYFSTEKPFEGNWGDFLKLRDQFYDLKEKLVPFGVEAKLDMVPGKMALHFNVYSPNPGVKALSLMPDGSEAAVLDGITAQLDHRAKFLPNLVSKGVTTDSGPPSAGRSYDKNIFAGEVGDTIPNPFSPPSATAAETAEFSETGAPASAAAVNASASAASPSPSAVAASGLKESYNQFIENKNRGTRIAFAGVQAVSGIALVGWGINDIVKVVSANKKTPQSASEAESKVLTAVKGIGKIAAGAGLLVLGKHTAGLSSSSEGVTR